MTTIRWTPAEVGFGRTDEVFYDKGWIHNARVLKAVKRESGSSMVRLWQTGNVVNDSQALLNITLSCWNKTITVDTQIETTVWIHCHSLFLCSHFFLLLIFLSKWEVWKFWFSVCVLIANTLWQRTGTKRTVSLHHSADMVTVLTVTAFRHVFKGKRIHITYCIHNQTDTNCCSLAFYRFTSHQPLQPFPGYLSLSQQF